MIYIGDVHGKWDQLQKVIEGIPKDFIQIGDLGIGFPHCDCPRNFGENFHFIRGNHDNVEVAKSHKNYLGEFGYWEQEGIFYISGAYSIDRDQRIEGITKWHNEELNFQQWHKVFSLYKKIKPKVVVSHDGPQSVLSNMFYDKEIFGSGTSYGLEVLLDINRPEKWFFGHWHHTRSIEIKGTKFTCVGCQFDSNHNQIGVDFFED